jgi:putative ATPase
MTKTGEERRLRDNLQGEVDGAAVYMALAPKSNSSYLAIDAALDEVRKGAARQVPNHLRDRHRPGSEAYGPYRYPHNDSEHWVDQQYLPDGIPEGSFYTAGDKGWEGERAAARARMIERRRGQKG